MAVTLERGNETKDFFKSPLGDLGAAFKGFKNKLF